ncbi:hypothetical protein FNF29_01968 [Cafeteria roenbergensis]|uniref:Uncharacterized protein n=1 Tax=Cafeteria roenbergensis TaxID=33653 RepID=A0A5A8CR68_CAFRO|nr:hypothetical protein FNF29_01968 [Cafeteria roenbergensis]|eukprot:KAA0155218.1 hypothetical protein FNF29_01968 [Cafeteria roenbergensis]
MSRETPAEAEEASIVLDAMKDALRDAVGEGPELRVFGSRVYGLALPWADWDVTIVKGSRGKIATLQALASALQRRPDFTEVNPILRARVPIVKCRHAATGIELDVSYGEESGCVSAAAVRAFVDQFPALVPLVVVLKHFLSQRGLNVTFKGGIGSFLLTCMVVHHLQMMRADTMVHVQGVRDVAWAQVALDREREAAGEARHAASDAAAAEAAKPRSRPRSQRVAALPRAQLNLGYLLFTFLEYFGRRFRYEHDAIVLVPEPCTISKYDYELGVPGRPFLLSLLSPVDDSADIGSNSFEIKGVRAAFFVAFLSLADALDHARPPLPGPGNTPLARQRALSVSPLAAVIAQDSRLRARADALVAEARRRSGKPHGTEEASPSRHLSLTSASGNAAKRARPERQRSGSVISLHDDDDDDSSDGGGEESSWNGSDSGSESSPVVIEDSSDSGSEQGGAAAAAGSAPASSAAAGSAAAPPAAGGEGPRSEEQAREAVIAAAMAGAAAQKVSAAAASAAATRGLVSAPAADDGDVPSLTPLIGSLRRPRLIADLLSGRRERNVEDEAATRGAWF